MKKSIALLLTVIFLGTSLAIPAYAAVKAGGACSKLGSTSIVGSTKYACIKSGKKLMWDAGSQVNPTSKSADYPKTPTSFADLYQYRSGIAYGAWLKNSKVLAGPTRSLPQIETYKGPNTDVYVKDLDQLFKFATRLFPNVEIPKRIVVLYWSDQDMAWANSKATELLGSEELKAVVKEIGGPFVDCYTPTNCNVGHAYIATDGTAYIGLGNPSNAGGDPNFALGQKEIVEFYHALQLFYYYKNNSPITAINNISTPNFPPAWLNVAGENYVFDAMRFEKDYNGFRSAQNFSDWMNHLGHPVTQEWLDDFLNIKYLNNSWSNNGFKTIADNVCIGASLIEIFVALKGPSVLLDFHELMSQGKSFDEVFKSEFGVSWEEAAPTISRVIFDKYQNKY